MRHLYFLTRLFFALFCFFSAYGQTEKVVLDTVHMYIRTVPNTAEITFKTENNRLKYTGNDQILAAILKNEQLLEFERTFITAKSDKLKRTYSVKVITSKIDPLSEEQSPSLKKTLIEEAPHIFEFGEVMADTTVKVYYPNDYGTSIKGKENKGYPVSLKHYDYLGMPQAWAYTTGSKNIIIGIVDGSLPMDNTDFKDKTVEIRKAPLAGGHGYNSGANAAAKGDNGFGIPGVCYDCDLFSTTYSASFKTFEQMVELSKAGAKVINCSFISTTYHDTAQEVINELYENGTLVVAGSGNRSWSDNKGEKLYYPASYDHVFSVTGITYKYETPYDNFGMDKKGKFYSQNIKNYLGRSLGFPNNDIEKDPFIWPISTATLNPMVDIAAPAVLVFSYGNYTLRPEYIYNKYQSTSMATPFVAGTFGLIFSLYPDMPLLDAESIVRMTATNIDYIPANKPFEGNYGAGGLHTGRAVKMAYEMITPSEVLTIENQKFNRWDFSLTAVSKQVVIKNESFTENASLQIKAKNSIIIKPNTRLQSSNSKGIKLSIVPETIIKSANN